MEQDILKILLNKLDRIEVGQQKLEAGQQKLEAEITGIKADITAIKAGQQKLENDITDIKKDTERIPYVERAVSEVNREVIAIDEKVQQLQETTEEHKIALGILSARSLEQEAKLTRIIL